MRKNQWLVPSRTAKLDKYGNVTGPRMVKMLNDIGAIRSSGFESRTRAKKIKWVWAETQTSTGQTVKGIWDLAKLRAYRPGALEMLVVDRRPRYGKRFHFHDIARRWAAIRAPRHARLAIQFAIKRR